MQAKDSARMSSNMLEFRTGGSGTSVSKRQGLPESAQTAAVEPPSFSAFEDHEAAEAGGNKKFLIAAILLIALGAAAYFGWTRTHSTRVAPAQQPAVLIQNQAPEVTPESTHPEPAPVAPATQLQPPSQPVSEPQPKETEGPSASKPTPALKASVIASTEMKTPPAASAPEPVLIKSGSAKPAIQSLVASEPVQPPVLGVASNGDGTAISGLISATPVNVPKPPAQALKVSQGISQGLLIKRVQPTYPAQARQMRLQGAVQLQATIGRNGSVINVKTLDGDAILARAAMDAVKQWKYQPYLLNGEPVEIQTQITVNFKLP
jgi:protein TonB